MAPLVVIFLIWIQKIRVVTEDASRWSDPKPKEQQIYALAEHIWNRGKGKNPVTGIGIRKRVYPYWDILSLRLGYVWHLKPGRYNNLSGKSKLQSGKRTEGPPTSPLLLPPRPLRTLENANNSRNNSLFIAGTLMQQVHQMKQQQRQVRKRERERERKRQSANR